MIPGELIPAAGDITLNEGATAITLPCALSRASRERSI